MKKFGLIITTLGLFAFSVALAFRQGSTPLSAQRISLDTFLNPAVSNPWVGSGLKGAVAEGFARFMNGLLFVTNHSVLWAVVLLALVVELLLLYPSVRIQLKQKKIHIFHKKVVDRFNKGELSVNATKDELQKVYEVNERLHRRGAGLVLVQVALFVTTFWGMNLIAKAPQMIEGSWSILNFSLLSRPVEIWVPLLVSLAYFLHAMIKIWLKEREDYISPIQTAIAILFAVAGATAVYYFSTLFALILSVYFVTLITVSTLRYWMVEQHAREWGKLAHQELVQMLREAKPYSNPFEYWSRKWNHLPVVRHINFNLLEEALSMSLGLLLALSFFGAFQKTEVFYADNRQPSPVVVQLQELGQVHP